jgi:O-antigen ligase
MNQWDVGGVAVGMSGRNHIWPVVIESAMRHPVVGGGLGSSQAALGDFDSETVGHPHNEYLRVWHDGGIIGEILLLLALLPWLATLGRQWINLARHSVLRPDVTLAAGLTLFGIMAAALTDNGFIYSFVMGPSGLLIGLALGLRSARIDAGAASSH